MQPPRNTWPQDQKAQRTLLLAQIFQEGLRPFEYESFRVSTLDLRARIREVTHLLVEFQNSNLGYSSIRPSKEELLKTLETDPVAQKISKRDVRYFQSSFAEKNTDSPGDVRDNLNLLRFIDKSIIPYYSERLKNEIIDRYYECKTSELVNLVNCYLSNKINCGHSPQDLQKLVKEVFFTKDFKRITISTTRSFFEKVPSERRDFYCWILCSASTYNLFKSLDFDRILPMTLSELPAGVSQGISGHNSKDWNHAVRVECSAFGRHSALNLALELLSTFTSLSVLDWQNFNLVWRDDGIASEKGQSDYTFCKAPPNRFKQYKRTISGRRAEQLVERTANAFHFLKNKSISRLLNASRNIRLARESDNAENQIVLLWSGIESLFGHPPERSTRISHYLETLIPSICFDYHRRYIGAIHARVLRHHRRALEEAFNRVKMPQSFSRQRKFDLYLFDRNFHYDHRRFLGTIPNPLARYRLMRGFENFRTSTNFRKSLAAHEQRVEWQLNRIYQTRNFLVHSDHTPEFTRSLLVNAYEYITSSLRNILFIVSEDAEKDNDLDYSISLLKMRYSMLKDSLSQIDDLEDSEADQAILKLFTPSANF